MNTTALKEEGFHVWQHKFCSAVTAEPTFLAMETPSQSSLYVWRLNRHTVLLEQMETSFKGTLTLAVSIFMCMPEGDVKCPITSMYDTCCRRTFILGSNVSLWLLTRALIKALMKMQFDFYIIDTL